MPWSLFSRPARIWMVLRGRVLLALVLACGLSLAFDAVALSADAGFNGHQWKVGYAGQTFYGDSPTSACQAANAANGPTYTFVSANYASASQYSCTANNGAGVVNYANAVSLSTCVSGYTLQADGSCKGSTACGAAGSAPSGWNMASGTSSTSTILNPQVCVGGCSYTYGSYWTGSKPGTSGYAAEWYGPIKSTGFSCTGSEVNASSGSVNSNSNVNCPDKTYQGTVNGQNVCIPYPTQTNSGTTSNTTTDTPASGVAATSNTSNTTTVTCDGNACSITTTVNNTGGSGVSGASGSAANPCASMQTTAGSTTSTGAGTCSSTTTMPQQQYCSQNPNDSNCQSRTAGGGADCSAAPACSGDAISCAILMQQWNTRCDLQKSQDPSIQLGQQIVSGQDPKAGSLPMPQQADAAATDMSQIWANAEDTTYQAQCMPDFDISLPALPGLSGGSSLHFDMAAFCKIGQLIGTLNVLGTLVVCAWMLRGIV